MNSDKPISDIRREYGSAELSIDSADPSPLIQFNQWVADAMATDCPDPTAMVLSTVDQEGNPDARVVLLKGVVDGRFVFYTNYESPKSKQILTHDVVSLVFYWPTLSRQVRIRGHATKTSEKQSDAYFYSRPLASQWSAVISPQSACIASREELEARLEVLRLKPDQPVVRPLNWGGFAVLPYQFEFWQGRDNRLHDRIQYTRTEASWKRIRIAP